MDDANITEELRSVYGKSGSLPSPSQQSINETVQYVRYFVRNGEISLRGGHGRFPEEHQHPEIVASEYFEEQLNLHNNILGIFNMPKADETFAKELQEYKKYWLQNFRIIAAAIYKHNRKSDEKIQYDAVELIPILFEEYRHILDALKFFGANKVVKKFPTSMVLHRLSFDEISRSLQLAGTHEFLTTFVIASAVIRYSDPIAWLINKCDVYDNLCAKYLQKGVSSKVSHPFIDKDSIRKATEFEDSEKWFEDGCDLFDELVKAYFPDGLNAKPTHRAINLSSIKRSIQKTSDPKLKLEDICNQYDKLIGEFFPNGIDEPSIHPFIKITEIVRVLDFSSNPRSKLLKRAKQFENLIALYVDQAESRHPAVGITEIRMAISNTVKPELWLHEYISDFDHLALKYFPKGLDRPSIHPYAGISELKSAVKSSNPSAWLAERVKVFDRIMPVYFLDGLSGDSTDDYVGLAQIREAILHLPNRAEEMLKERSRVFQSLKQIYFPEGFGEKGKHPMITKSDLKEALTKHDPEKWLQTIVDESDSLSFEYFPNGFSKPSVHPYLLPFTFKKELTRKGDTRQSILENCALYDLLVEKHGKEFSGSIRAVVSDRTDVLKKFELHLERAKKLSNEGRLTINFALSASVDISLSESFDKFRDRATEQWRDYALRMKEYLTLSAFNAIALDANQSRSSNSSTNHELFEEIGATNFENVQAVRELEDIFGKMDTDPCVIEGMFCVVEGDLHGAAVAFGCDLIDVQKTFQSHISKLQHGLEIPITL